MWRKSKRSFKKGKRILRLTLLYCPLDIQVLVQVGRQVNQCGPSFVALSSSLSKSLPSASSKPFATISLAVLYPLKAPL
uniref:Uncharacterized protein n=1 Tax=Cucumis melo TaxID=3656 RepID=A0A9I9E9J2_CUCME